MKKEWLVKTLALSIVVLFIGTGVVSAFNVNQDDKSIIKIDNHPPNAPKIRGKVYVKPAKLYNYIFNATDPDGDNVSYEIDWSDGTSEKWIGPYASGEEIIQSHTYFITHTNSIKARAKDTQGAIGEWGYLIPDSKDKQMTNPLNLKFLEQFHYAFPILKYVFRGWYQ